MLILASTRRNPINEAIPPKVIINYFKITIILDESGTDQNLYDRLYSSYYVGKSKLNTYLLLQSNKRFLSWCGAGRLCFPLFLCHPCFCLCVSVLL